MNDLIIADTKISITDGLYRLNDLHKAAGGLSKDAPKDWLLLESTKELINLLNEEKDDSGNPLSKQNQTLVIIKNGGKTKQGTYACKELVYSYAMWISPRFHISVIRAYDSLVNSAAQYDVALDRWRKVMLLEKPSAWALMYTENFYRPVMKLFGWTFEGNSGGLPAVIGMITRQWIYEIVVPAEILQEIDEKKESEKIHQWFSEQNGREKLEHQIAMVSGIAKTCQTYGEFKIKAGCVFNDTPLQLEMF
jgi:hypothetical protein